MSATNGNAGSVHPIDITRTMQDAYLDYAMSVIVSRALPDVRDGLKPVHRRILYAISHDLNLTHNKPHKKSARIVGEVLGKYHPHGDTAVYDAMVRMAQDFSLRYPLVDGQGNFGSIDGDNAAAMRYTEARLAEISQLMLDDLDKETVEWHENFDNSLLEPDILPAALPNLLINGASGIAVGMATNIPPHNLGEVVDALAYMIDNYENADEITVDDLTQFIKGPDFPTGGILYRYRVDPKTKEENDVVTQGYSVGKARLIIQAKAHFEEMSRNRNRIVITELPYQTNKTSLIERIATLVRDGKIEGITDLRDESDRTGMRIVIELTRNVDAKNVLASLFKYTPLQQTFGMQLLALVDGQPVLLSLKRALRHFIEHRREIIRRRSEFDLTRARDRAHILEGLLKALDILDEVIATIRRSQRVETARTNLMRNFGFTQIQAQAILDMQLRRLAALERRKLQDEHDELLKRIAYLEDLLAHPEKVLGVIKDDLLAIKEKYGDPRRTQIVDRTKGTLTTTDLLPEQDVWVSVGANGNLHRHDVVNVTTTTVKRSGKHSEVALLTANTRDYLYLFSAQGQCRRVSIHEIPQDGKQQHLANLTEYSRRDNITAALSLPRTTADAAEGYVFMVTEQGVIKRVTAGDFLSAAPLDPVVINVENRDKLLRVFYTPGDVDVLLVANNGKAIRFNEGAVRSMGLAAGGVGGMKLKQDERIVYAGIVDPEGELITATEKGFAKRTSLTDYPAQGRNGGGVVTHKPNARTGEVTAALVVPVADDLMLAVTTAQNQLLTSPLSIVPQMGRGVQGKQVFAVGIGDALVAIQMQTLPPSPTSPDDDPGAKKSKPDAKTTKPTTGKPKGKPTGRKVATATATTVAATKVSKGPAKARKPRPSKSAPKTATKSATKRTPKPTPKTTAKPASKAANTTANKGAVSKKSTASTRKSPANPQPIKSTKRTTKQQSTAATKPTPQATKRKSTATAKKNSAPLRTTTTNSRSTPTKTKSSAKTDAKTGVKTSAKTKPTPKQPAQKSAPKKTAQKSSPQTSKAKATATAKQTPPPPTAKQPSSKGAKAAPAKPPATRKRKASKLTVATSVSKGQTESQSKKPKG